MRSPRVAVLLAALLLPALTPLERDARAQATALTAVQVKNAQGGPLAIGDVVHYKADGTVEKARADTAAHAAGALLVMITGPADAAYGYASQTPAWVKFCTSPTAGGKAYLSTATAGCATATAPTVSGTNQQRVLGNVQRVNGSLGLVIGSIDNDPLGAAGVSYITQTTTNAPSSAQALGALSSGMLKVTTTTGVVASWAATSSRIPFGSGTAGALTDAAGLTWNTSGSGALTLGDGATLVVGTSTGTKIGTATSQKLSLWNATPVVQPNGTGETTGFTAGAGTAVKADSTFTGNVGSTAYNISDIVKALKQLGALAP